MALAVAHVTITDEKHLELKWFAGGLDQVTFDRDDILWVATRKLTFSRLGGEMKWRAAEWVKVYHGPRVLSFEPEVTDSNDKESRYWDIRVKIRRQLKPLTFSVRCYQNRFQFAQWGKRMIENEYSRPEVKDGFEPFVQDLKKVTGAHLDEFFGRRRFLWPVFDPLIEAQRFEGLCGLLFRSRLDPTRFNLVRKIEGDSVWQHHGRFHDPVGKIPLEQFSSEWASLTPQPGKKTPDWLKPGVMLEEAVHESTKGGVVNFRYADPKIYRVLGVQGDTVLYADPQNFNWANIRVFLNTAQFSSWFRIYDPANHTSSLKTALYSLCRIQEQSMTDLLDYLKNRPELQATEARVLKALHDLNKEWLIQVVPNNDKSLRGFKAPNARLKGGPYVPPPDVRLTAWQKLGLEEID